MRRLTLAAGAAAVVVSLLAFAAPAGASEPGTVSSHGAAIACAVAPGHYCAKVFATSVTGGIDVNQTRSTGYTRGPGKGREWFRYNCTAGICFILPSALFVYGSADVQLNVTRTFAGSGFFLPCGNVFGVQYRLPAKNAPGPRALLFKVVCAHAGNTVVRA